MIFVFRDLARRGVLVALGSSLLMMAACADSDPPPVHKSSVPLISAQAPEAPVVARRSVDYMAGLKNIKDESKVVTREELERSSAEVVESAKIAKSKSNEAAKRVEPKPEPAPVVAAAPPPVQAAPPRPAAPADNIVAKAAPTAAPVLDTTATPLTRETPSFPRDAVRAGIDTGVVRAKILINSAGDVTDVQIVEARPSRVFDRAVRESLARWKFNKGADRRSYDAEIEFNR